MDISRIDKLSSAIQFYIKNDKSRLVQFSFLMLFVELTLIRWAGANIYYLFAFANFVLIASFLGIGIGFLRSKSSVNYFSFAPIFLAAVIYICYKFSYQYQAVVDKSTDNLDYTVTYFKEHLYPIWITLPIVFIMVTALMSAIADGVARTFQLFLPLEAYRLEVLGSLLGIIVFSILSYFHASPVYWGIVISLLFVSLLMRQWKAKNFLLTALQLAALAVIITVFAKDTMTPGHYWSSYYKIELQEYSKHRYAVNVNGLTQQVIESVEQRRAVKPFYFLPYQHRIQSAPLNNVLIIGAGTGGDVAIALSQGAKHVDAVEIDPTLYSLGKKFNPDRPYFDPRVNVIINDGRAFLQQTSQSYDLIIFALTDSLFLIPGQSSLRLENYLYTLEGLSMAKKRLAPGGVFAIYNYYGQRWFLDRLANTLAIVYQMPPCLDTFSPKDYWATVLTASQAKTALQCPARWESQNPELAAPSTDDHPFIYLQYNHFSSLYIAMLLFIFLTASILVIRGMSNSYRAIRIYLDLFFMGTAFLLLETKSIISYALLFGTTWFVNALVFIGILSTVYLAIEVTERSIRIKPVLLYGLLFGTLFLAWIVPLSFLLSLSILSRFMIATVLVFSPIFIANIIFAERFRQTATSTDAFGVNLIGAVLGGLLEYFAMIFGYHNLLILIAVLYAVAILLMRKRMTAS
jgi:spermidine synthase